MTYTPKVRVYMGCSFDGFIAGPDNDITWLDRDYRVAGDLPVDTGTISFDRFMSQTGAILMGRATYGIVESHGHWHYGDTPTLIATHRPLQPIAETVRSVSGPIDELIAAAREAAGDKDIYLDGGSLVRQALNAGLVDELTLTFLPLLLGSGIRLFDELLGETRLQFTAHNTHEGGFVQVTARVLHDEPRESNG